MKFALLSRVLPPTWSGQAVVIYRLLHGLNPHDYCLISLQNYDVSTDEDSYSRKLPGPYYHLPPERSFRHGGETINILLRILLRARKIAKIMRQEKCGAVIACTGDFLDLPAGYVASRLTGTSFYPYLFDDYSHQWIKPWMTRLAQRFEPRLMRGAARIIAPNEFLRDELRRRYGVEATVIHNPCDLSEYESVSDTDDVSNRNNSTASIVYTGAVYDAHYDAFRNLLAAIQSLKGLDVKLHLYTAQSPSELVEKGIDGPIVHHGHQAIFAMPRIQRQADLLFLPLAFNSPYPKVVRTAAPGKLGEYLAARRPILVHAPPDSFVAWYFRRHECGLVVDESDPVKLAQGIEMILCDASLRQQLATRAGERARADFSVLTAQSRFAELMKLDVPIRRM